MSDDDYDDIPDSMQELYARQKEERDVYLKHLTSEGKVAPKVYPKLDETDTAYKYVLDTGDKAKEALEHTAEQYNKSNDWVDKVKHNRIHPQILKTVMKKNENHPVSLAMKEKNVLNLNTKRGLKEAKSINALLNALSSNVNLTKRVEALEEAVLVLAGQIDSHTEELDTLGTRIATLEEDLKPPKVALKELALEMAQEGYKRDEIATELGKSKRTIQRWLQE